MNGVAYDGTPLQAGTEEDQHQLTGVTPHFSALGLREMVVIDRKFVDEDGNRSRSYVEYTCRDLQTMTALPGCRRVNIMGGIVNGDEYVLRPATVLRVGGTQKISKQTPAINTDGDRVLVGFIEGSQSRPVILGVLTHTFSKYGATLDQGDRRFTTHNGTTIEIDKLGQYTLTHKSGSLIKFFNDGSIQLTPASGKDLFIGASGATENLVLGQKLKTFLNNMINALLAAQYPTGVGPTGPMLPPQQTVLQNLQTQLDDLLSNMSFTTQEV